MPRYIAFLRGVSPMNLKMSDLKQCLEAGGFKDVKTLLSSGNAAFTARAAAEVALQAKVEKSLAKHLGRTFQTIVRSTGALQAMLDADPYARLKLPVNAKRVVTFLREPHEAEVKLPPARDGTRIVAVKDREVFSVYVPNERGPVFMALIEKTFGKNVTTRTWDTVSKCAKA